MAFADEAISKYSQISYAMVYAAPGDADEGAFRASPQSILASTDPRSDGSGSRWDGGSDRERKGSGWQLGGGLDRQ